MNVVQEFVNTLPRAIELIQAMCTAIFVEADTSDETEEPVFRRDMCMILYFTVLYFCLRKGCRVGVLTALFLILYGIFRFAIEFFREPDLHIGYFFEGTLTLGQILKL